MSKYTRYIVASLLVLGSLSAFEVMAKPKKVTPPPSGTFQVSEGMNRDYGMIQMTDSSGDKWPMFWLSHPQGIRQH